MSHLSLSRLRVPLSVLFSLMRDGELSLTCDHDLTRDEFNEWASWCGDLSGDSSFSCVPGKLSVLAAKQVERPRPRGLDDWIDEERILANHPYLMGPFHRAAHSLQGWVDTFAKPLILDSAAICRGQPSELRTLVHGVTSGEDPYILAISKIEALCQIATRLGDPLAIEPLLVLSAGHSPSQMGEIPSVAVGL